MFVGIALFIAVVSALRWHQEASISRFVLDQQEKERDVFKKILELRSSSLRAFVTDYTYWDEMVDFVTGPLNEQWAQENLDASFNTFGADVFWVYSSVGDLVYANDMDKEGLKDRFPLSKEIFPYLFFKTKIPHFFAKTSAGELLELYAATIHPTADSERKTESKGYFFVGKVWDEQWFEEFSSLVSGEVALKELTQQDSPLGDIFFSYPLFGWDGRVAEQVYVKVHSRPLAQFVNILRRELIFIVFFGFLIAFGAMIFLARWLIVPLRAITKSLQEARSDLLSRFEKGNDEFSVLARLIRDFFKQKIDLEAQNEFVSSLINSSPAFFVAISLDGKTMLMNQAMLEATGYRQEEVVGREYLALFVPEEDRSAVKEAFERIISQGKPVVTENRIIAKDGRRTLVEWHGVPVKNKNTGKIEYFFGIGLDITLRKESDLLLRKERDRARLYFDAAGTMLVVLDRNGRVVLINKAAEKILGYSLEELKGRDWFENCLPAGSRLRVKEIFNSLMQGDNASFLTAENPIVSKQGEERIVIWNNNLIREEGKVIGTISSGEDVTELRRQQRLSLEKSQRAFALQGAILELAKSQYAFLEDALRDMLETGAKALGVERCSVWLFSQGSDAIECKDLYSLSRTTHDAGRVLLVKDFPSYFKALEEKRLVLAPDTRIDPQTKELASSYFEPLGIGSYMGLSLISGGKTIGILSHEHVGGPREWSSEEQGFALSLAEMIVREIERAEHRHAEERYRLMIETSHEGIWLMDEHFRISFVNARTQEMLGYSQDEMLGKDIKDFMFSEDFKDHEDKIEQHKAGIAQTHERRFRRKDGSVLWALVSAAPITDKEGNFCGSFAMFTDITDRKIAEEDVRQAYEQLKETQMQLLQTEKMAAVGQLASGVGHEINNPLTGVLNNVQLIKMLAENKKEDFDFKELSELLDIVEESALRCKKIAQTLLDFSHAAKGSFEPLDLNLTVEKVISLMQYELKLGNIRLTKDLQQGLPRILGDMQLLQQVIFNLVSNAKWAIDKKGEGLGGEIVLRTFYLQEKKSVCAEVSDTGIGIPPEQQKKIFEPFFTTKPVGEGTGLGLSVAFRIIKDHKGSVELKSEPGKGTNFTIILPAMAEV